MLRCGDGGTQFRRGAACLLDYSAHMYTSAISISHQQVGGLEAWLVLQAGRRAVTCGQAAAMAQQRPAVITARLIGAADTKSTAGGKLRYCRNLPRLQMGDVSLRCQRGHCAAENMARPTNSSSQTRWLITFRFQLSSFNPHSMWWRGPTSAPWTLIISGTGARCRTLR